MAPKKANAIRAFRHDYAQLKKLGLVSKKTDARSVKPTKARLATLKKYRPVLTGHAGVVKLTPQMARDYAEANTGARVVKSPQGTRVVIPKSTDEKLSVTRAGYVRRSHAAGIERVQMPVKFHELEQYLLGIKRNRAKIDAMKKRGEQFAFSFFGNLALSAYDSIEDIINDLLEYPTVENAINENDAEVQQEIYQMLEILKFKRGLWPGASDVRARKTAIYQHARYERRKKKTTADQHEYQNEKAAERMREYRARMKEQKPAQYEAYKRAGRERKEDSLSARNAKKARSKKGKK